MKLPAWVLGPNAQCSVIFVCVSVASGVLALSPRVFTDIHPWLVNNCRPGVGTLLSVKGQIVDVLGFAGHMASGNGLAAAVQKQPQTPPQ